MNLLLNHRYIHFYTTLSLLSLLILSSLPSLTAQDTRPRRVRSGGGTFVHIPRTTSAAARTTGVRHIFRTIDGTCNNISNPAREEWGASDIALYREMNTRYGQPDRRNDMGGQNRINPRVVSNNIVAQSESLPSAQNFSSLVFTWGQFLDHDIDLTPEGHIEYHPVTLPNNEPLFTEEMPFLRSEAMPGTGEDNPRQQRNLITSWVDASNVYGSEATRAAWLRTFQDGKLRTSEGNLLPYNTTDGEFGSPVDPNAPSMAAPPHADERYFVAGDVRANEQPGLTALHTIFMREHNRICDQLVDNGVTGDEEIYQRARKRVGALIQKITYRDFLPALGIQLPTYRGYNPNLQPDIKNLFATAAYRLGHTMVTNDLLLLDNNCNLVDDDLALVDGFFNPSQLAAYGVAPILKGLSAQVQEEVDVKMIDNLRNFLFAVDGSDSPFGLDLASLNIQRGRDHGLPDYNAMRGHYLGTQLNNIRQITDDPALRNALQTTYGNVNNIDAWVGLLAEDKLPGAALGPTLTAIMQSQFSRLRDGDYYFYQNDPEIDNDQEGRINNTSLADIIERNTAVNSLQNNIFIAAPCNQNNDDDNDGGGNGGGGNGGNDGNGGGGNGGNGGGGNGGNGGGGNGGNGGGGNGGNGGGGNGGNGGGGNGGNGGGGNGGNGGGGNDGNGGGGNGGNGGGGNGGNGGGGNGGPGGNIVAGDGNAVTGRIATNANTPLSSEFKVFPNPSNGLINVRVAYEAGTKVEISVISVDGKVQYYQNATDTISGIYTKQLNLDLPTGTYFVRVITGQEVLTDKVIINRE